MDDFQTPLPAIANRLVQTTLGLLGEDPKRWEGAALVIGTLGVLQNMAKEVEVKGTGDPLQNLAMVSDVMTRQFVKTMMADPVLTTAITNMVPELMKIAMERGVL